MKLRYTPLAAAQLDKVLAGIAAASPQGARNVKSRIQAMINLILQFPDTGTLTSKRRFRRVVVHPFPDLIFYRATGRRL